MRLAHFYTIVNELRRRMRGSVRYETDLLSSGLGESEKAVEDRIFWREED